MSQKPQFSVLLSFQNQRDEVEPSLTALYELESIPFELIVIDDASSDGTGQAIHSLIDYYQHDYTFFFDHAEPAGRGNCLNEALQQTSTSLIWAPESIGSIGEELLRSAIKKLNNGSTPCLTQKLDLPVDLSGWIDIIRQGQLPRDGQFFWNKNHIASGSHFFDPYLSRYHGIELLLRLGMDAMETDQAFFTPSEFEQLDDPTPAERQELIIALLRRPGTPAPERKKLAEFLLNLPKIEKEESTKPKESLLEKAAKLKMEGQLSASLELVEEVLKNEPDNPEAKHLKIKLLERKRRFVEASELKHEMQATGKFKNKHPDLGSRPVKTSIIIPTALYGKPALEHCLVSAGEHCNPNTAELIIIDNASLDNTHEYLQELKERNFLNCRVITNEINKGFAASVNQGLEAAQGEYACVVHNDVEFTSPAITRLEQLMDNHAEYALLAPLADSSLNPDQLMANKEMFEGSIVQADYIDSFCMMIRMEAGIRMDEKYGLAFFDDIDFSFETRKQGYKVGVTPGVEVKHHYGTTTFAIDLDTESELYWKNVAYFNDKWDVQTFSEEDLQAKSRFEQLLALDELVNPLYPEEAIKEKFNELFTDEMRTEILKTSHEPETLLHLIHLLMVMGKRDVMRQLEDRADDIEFPPALIYELVRFYFDRNVYSRCQHYLDQLTSQQESLQADLYRLAMLIDEKKIKKAIPLLTQLLEHAPSNPMLYRLAGDMHAFKNNKEEAESFYSLAHQINPFDYTETQKEIRLNN